MKPEELELGNAVNHFYDLIHDGGLVEIESYAEYGFYDDSAYDFMCRDAIRMDAFSQALNRCVSGKTVLDVGTGDRAPLAFMSAEMGAKKVIGVEWNSNAALKATRIVEEAGLDDRIQIINCDVRKLVLEERADVCVSDMIGHLAGAEGAAIIMGDVKHRLMKENGRMIPQKASTVFAPACKPKCQSDPLILTGREYYKKQIRHFMNGDVYFRKLLYNTPKSCLLADSQVFEELLFTEEVSSESKRSVQFTINRIGILNSFIAWCIIDFTEDITISTFSDSHWAPVIIEIDSPVTVQPGDTVHCDCTVQLSCDHLHTSYFFKVIIERNGTVLTEFQAESPYGNRFSSTIQTNTINFSNIQQNIIN